MINVTKTYLPDFDLYTQTLKRAWDSAWITNNGALVQELETALKLYLDSEHLFFTNNGTVVLQMALKALNITKEVITTPFSYVATTNAIVWENATPIFVDINPNTFCIDADKIEAKITANTEAILATHVYGIPCDVEKIEAIAKKYNLRVIYDAAHAFGCLYKGKSLLNYGDVSTCSFHATKIFHTVEGGCIIANDADLAHQLMLFRQFGHINDDYFTVGINAKSSEFHAAMGLCVLPDIQLIIDKRKSISDYYSSILSKNKQISFPIVPKDTIYNYPYYIVVFETEEILLKIKAALQKNGIGARRYFYPSLNQLPFLTNQQSCPISEDLSRRVLSLPLSFELTNEQVEQITSIILAEL
jgi:dTDP-4-amino-4,6-dideoxygalactose transaminase